MFGTRNGRVISRLAAIAVVLLLAACSNTIRVSQQEIQQQIDSRLPLGTPASSPIAVNLQSLHCELLTPQQSGGNNNVALLAQVRFAVLGFFQRESRAGLQGRLAYDAGRGAFFIEQPQLTSLDVGQLPSGQQQLLMTNLQQVIASILAVTPVYTLEDERARNHIDRVEVRDNVMLIHLKP